ncbi:MAG TPA: 30S ribosomal protein S6 [Terriglobales bacterium]|nr:30S ribosomal protein S6 [Terriglobales bacterium]
MRKYETAFILVPGLDEATLEKEIKKVEELIENNKGKIIQTDRWGLRKLTYRIKKKLEGYYVITHFEGPTAIIRELDRYYKLDENVLRFLNVVKVEKKPSEKELSSAEGAREKTKI